MDFRKLQTFCAFDINDDPVIRAIYLMGTQPSEVLSCYPKVLNTLAVKGQTLSDYCRDLLTFTESALVSECVKSPTSSRLRAVEYDVGIIRELCSVTAREVKKQINYDNNFNFLWEMPDYEIGVFDYGADYFIEFARHKGTGMFAKYKAFTFSEKLRPIERLDPIRLYDLKNYEVQRRQVLDNTVRFLEGKPAHNALLYGDRGTGKSSTIKAILNEYSGLRMVEVSKNDVDRLPTLFEVLEKQPLRFIVMIDDLSFAENDDRFSALKAVLEGSLAARPDNVLIYATTNRRKIVRETNVEREVSGADAIDESMSLSDRFGLFVTFTKPDKAAYLDIVRQLADDEGIRLPREELFAGAETFALRRGGRSPRIARQYIDEIK